MRPFRVVVVLFAAVASLVPVTAAAVDHQRWLHGDYDILLGYGCTTFQLEPVDSRFDCPEGFRVHEGIDFATPTGTAVYAGMPGVVDRIGEPGTDLKDFGPNYVVIWLDEGHDAVLGHLSARVVHEGQRLRAGDLVGYTGDLGETNVPNLHIEIRPHGGTAYDSIDPTPYVTLVGAEPDAPAASPAASSHTPSPAVTVDAAQLTTDGLVVVVLGAAGAGLLLLLVLGQVASGARRILLHR